MEGLREPLPGETRALLREAVRTHVRTVRGQRVQTPWLHTGTPGGAVQSVPLDRAEPFDPGLRCDVVAALRVRARDAARLVWLTRAGDLAPQDVDGVWLSAARSAYVEAGLELTFVVVTRQGWRDPRSGLEQRWARVRP
ncbi:hypothetical protein G5V58_07680 [Nocardioides anomalus]|uniref:Uncharacterized protein n=1 Tax=Nocardioides anomalus TaxID=2712223 RepID=A0A6G6WBZ4_9ACTN|nr:hypothetical protein [Nocardioides anomalus]QIG42677.1 hypothetical protein G5V58_07680 [Nocardioides anomalus]